MKLKSIFVFANHPGGGFHGSMKLQSPEGHEIDLKFDNEFGSKIIGIIAEHLVGEAKRLANQLTQDCIDAQTKSIEVSK